MSITWECGLERTQRKICISNSLFYTFASINDRGKVAGSVLFELAPRPGVGLDEIFERVEDVDKAYMGSAKDLMEVVKKYGVKYVYVGFEELKNYPIAH